MKFKLSLTKKFLLYSFITLVSSAIVLSFILTGQFKSFILERIKEENTSHIKEHASILTKEVFENPELNQKVFDEYRHMVETNNLNRLIIYNGNGKIIHSNDQALIGQEFENEKFKKSIESNSPVVIFGNSQNEKEHENESSKNIIEVYVPITPQDNNVPAGVVEFSFDITSVLKSISIFQLSVWGLILAFFVILFLSLYWIFRRASKTIIDQNVKLFYKTDELNRKNEEKKSILNSIGELLFVLNNKDEIVLANKKALDIIGGKILHKKFSKVLKIKSEKVGKVSKIIDERKLMSANYKEGIILETKDKNLIPVSLTVAPIIHKDKNFIGTVINIHDATSEKELNRIKDEFVYVVAHELANPIFILDGYLGMLLKNSSLNKDSKNLVKTAQGINMHLSNLVTDLLEAVKSESGQLLFEKTEVDLKKITSEVIKDLETKAKNKNIALSYHPIKNLPKIVGNNQKVKEVLINLIDNAIKYSPKNSHIEVSHHIHENKLSTLVRDNGIGMTKEEQKRLFEKFYRVKNEKTKNIHGTGLGLFICKQLVEKMGGTIKTISKEEQGTTMVFNLPIARKKTSPKKPALN